MKRKNKIFFFIGLVVAIIVSICTSSIGSMVLLVFSLSLIDASTLSFSYSSYAAYKKTPITGEISDLEIEQYNKETIINGLKYDCPIFPDIISNGKIKYFEFIDPLLEDLHFPRAEFFLEWITDKETFEKDIQRIEKYEASTNKKILLSNDLFSFKSYVASYDMMGEYEYALFDEETYTIRYIYLFDVESRKNIIFPNEYAPTKTLKDSDISRFANFSGEYSIRCYP